LSVTRQQVGCLVSRFFHLSSFLFHVERRDVIFGCLSLVSKSVVFTLVSFIFFLLSFLQSAATSFLVVRHSSASRLSCLSFLSSFLFHVERRASIFGCPSLVSKSVVLSLVSFIFSLSFRAPRLHLWSPVTRQQVGCLDSRFFHLSSFLQSAVTPSLVSQILFIF
jgi:hypothetical protein